MSKKRKKLSRNGVLRVVISVLIVVLGLGLVVYPLVGDYLNGLHASEVHTTYDNRVSQMDRSAIEAELERANAYNNYLAENKYTIVDPYGNASYDQDLYQDYTNTLNIDDHGTMAYIEIPCINVFLPVYHGTSEEVLEAGVGHIQQTSLPVGGPSTHAILTGHTGLSVAKLFTDVDKMEIGDIFFIHVYDQDLAYEVDDINIVTPDDTSKLQIIDGEDHVTLITCYPYGKNTHRLLVRGTRTEYDTAVQTARQQENTSSERGSTRYEHYFKSLFGSIIVVVLIIAVISIVRKKRNKKLNAERLASIDKLTRG